VDQARRLTQIRRAQIALSGQQQLLLEGVTAVREVVAQAGLVDQVVAVVLM
jgi:hypothetical protein